MGNTFGASSTSTNGADALVAAALVKDDAKVASLLSEGADPKAQDKQGNHGLGAACCSGSEKCVEILMGNSATPLDLKNTMGCSPVWLAAGYGHLKILEKLLAAGADANAPNGTGDTPLIAAASRANESCIHALLDAGANVAARNRNGDSLLTLAAGRGLSEVVEGAIATLQKIDAGGDIINAPNGKGVTPVAAAAAFGDARSVRALMAVGADATIYRDKNGATGLMVACHCSSGDCVAAILEEHRRSDSDQGAASTPPNLEAADAAGATALWLAAAAGCSAAVSSLLAAGADKLGGSPGGISAEKAATNNGHAACAALLS